VAGLSPPTAPLPYLTEVVAFAELFVSLGSGFDALTVAVLVIVAPRPAVTCTTSCIPAPAGLAGLNGANAPTLQVTVPLLKAQGVAGWETVQLTPPLLLAVQLPAAY